MAVTNLRATLVALLATSPALADPLPLWELETGGNRVLIMGSVHFLRASDYPLPDGMMEAYDQADTLVMEIDLDNLDPMATLTTMTTMGTDRSGRTLKDMIGAPAYNDASAKAKELGVPLDLFSQFEPWFAALSITQMRMMQLGFDPAWGIETRLMQKAATDGKSILGLETLEEQLGFMDRLDAGSQRAFLLQSLDDAASVQEEVDTIVSSWRGGDTDTLETLLIAGIASAPALYDAILVKRNRSWVEPIRDLTRQSDNYLVIVGAMHLVGKNSVLEMLEDAGIESRQLSN
ncbi:MAG: TraB/GumN family protein [Gammaproteobacteria bacterium]|jgi:hypothetical protein|nr:TraB/GumN family protein [Gammaproteobacteria bacterium]